MKSLKYILIFLIPIFIGCQTGSSNYEVLYKSKTVTKDDCKVPITYPQIQGDIDTVSLNRINEILERLPEHEFYAHNCDSENPQLVSGKFKVLLKQNSVLCIEYQTDIEYKNEHRTIFHSLIINPNGNAAMGFGSIGIEPIDLIPNFDRGKLLPYIKKYNSDKKDNVNLLAYEKGSNYVITWGITEKDFIIYPGGEGEWFGYDKVEIPLNELK
jgi:hypothetical protein